MKTKILTIATVLLLSTPALPDQIVHDTARTHLENYLLGAYEKLETTYAKEVVLMPGHEFLKKEYGLAGPKGRSESVTVGRAKLLAVMTKADEGRPPRPAERVKAMMKTLAFKTLKATPGDYATPPSDPVKTPDRNLHFKIEKGDVLMKVAPPTGDYLLYQLRKSKGKWRIVAEYLD